MPRWLEKPADWLFIPVVVASVVLGEPLLYVVDVMLAVILFWGSLKKKDPAADAE